MCKIAMLSVHGCPLTELGAGESGGMQLYIRALSRELGRQGHQVDVYTRRVHPDLPRVVPFGPNARVIHLDAGEPAPMEKNSVFDVLPEFVANLDRFRESEEINYDYIHSHYWLSGWVGERLARRWDRPNVTMFHTLGRLKNQAMAEGVESDLRIGVEQDLIRDADRIIASSDHERQALVELYGARRERVAIVPCGVDLDRFRAVDQGQARARLGVEGDVLVFVGRMDPIKGLDLLLRSVALLRHRSQLTLLVVGGASDDLELPRYESLASALGLGSRVRFCGTVPQEQLPIYYSAASVCVVPSYYESFGLVAMEALACGTPVVGSMVGGLPTVVHDDENGLLVPKRTPQAFAEKIERILQGPSYRQQLAALARPSVERFGWGAVAEQVTEVYRQLGTGRALTVSCSGGIVD